MCRMLAVVGSREAARTLAGRFQREAAEGRVAQGASPGHADGWGIVFAMADGELEYAGRSTRNAAVDPEYPRAVERLAAAASRGALLAHVRKASLGPKIPENTHPFVAEGLAFCHNGTVTGIAPVGENDSREVFARILAERRKGASVEDAITSVARDVDRHHSFTSLTFLLTDGREAWGLRRVGNDPVHCAPEACATDYYTLGHATLADGSVAVSQEHEVLGLPGWQPVADGALVHVDASGRVSTRKIL